MAVDYSQYARSAGSRLDTTGIQKGIDTFMKNRKEAIVTKANELSNTTYSGMMSPWENFTSTDVADWDINSLPNMTAGQLLEQYKTNAKAKGQKVYNELLNAGKFDPANFKKQYDSIKQEAMPLIEQKLVNYMDMKGLSDKEMRAFINKKGLNNMLIDSGNAGPMRDLALPKEKGFFGKARENITGSQAAKLGTSALFAKPLISTAYSGPSKDLTAKQSKTLTNIISKSSEGKRIQGSFDKKSQKIIDQAKTKYDKGFEEYKKTSKAKKPSTSGFNKTKAGAELNKNIFNKQIQSKASSGKGITAIKEMTDKVIKKHGKAKALRLIARRLGPKAGLSIAAKMGLGMIPAGVTQGIAGGLLVSDVIMVYNILKELAE